MPKHEVGIESASLSHHPRLLALLEALQSADTIIRATSRAAKFAQRYEHKADLMRVIEANAHVALGEALTRAGIIDGPSLDQFYASLSATSLDPRIARQMSIDAERVIRTALFYTTNISHPDAGSSDTPIERARYSAAALEVEALGTMIDADSVKPDTVKKAITRYRKRASEYTIWQRNIRRFTLDRARICLAYLPRN